MHVAMGFMQAAAATALPWRMTALQIFLHGLCALSKGINEYYDCKLQHKSLSSDCTSVE